MRRVPTIAVVLLGISVAGCRNAGNHELLERELRLQEDKISQLESELEQARAQIQERCRDTGVIVPDTGYERPFTIAPSRGRNAPSAGPSRTTSPPEVTLPSGEAAPPYQGPPVIQPPDPKVPEGHLPGASCLSQPRPMRPPWSRRRDPRICPVHEVRKTRRGSGPAAGIRDGTGRGQRDHDQSWTDGSAHRGRHIQRGDDRRGHRAASRGRAIGEGGRSDLDRRARPVEGRARGENRPLGLRGRPDRAILSRRPARGGMVFNLRWPTAPPQHGSLQLFVRLTTPDGRKLVADTELTALGAKPAARETGQLGDPPNSAIRLVSDAESLPQTNWRRSRTPMPRSEALPTRTEISLTRAEPPAPAAGPAPPTAEFSRKPGEPRRLPDDVLDGTAAVPIDSAAPPRDERLARVSITRRLGGTP